MTILRVTRREFIAGLGGAATWPLVARGQQPTMPTIGYLDVGTPETTAPVVAAFKQGLLDTGYVENKNIAIEYRWANGQYESLSVLAVELVHKQVSVIATVTPVAALAAKTATNSIPIVFSLGSDPVRDGLVASLNRPGGNITGATFFSNLLSAKRLELLHQLMPDLGVIAILLNPKNANVEIEKRDTRESARLFGFPVTPLEASSEREIESAVDTLSREAPTALIISGDEIFWILRQQIAKLALHYKIPTSCPYRDQAVAGCLMSYGAGASGTFRGAGQYVGRILKGEKPADLPVLQPTKFELVINLKTAKALGLTVPPTLLARADEVIE